MKGLRLVVCSLAALGLGAITYLGIGQLGLAGEGGLAGGFYFNLVTYPTMILMGGFGFWIAFAVTDPGSDK